MTHLEPEQNKRRRPTTINNARQTGAGAAAQSTQSTNKTKLPLR